MADSNDKKTRPVGIPGIAMDSFEGVHALRVHDHGKNAVSARQLGSQANSSAQGVAQGKAPATDATRQGSVSASFSSGLKRDK